ncbi:MAG: hypothetical protein DMD33_02555 [Gemmatimonadetes bacterium]|nr:MAG: hypothetical protein DMD33_02555 [Gemmatimonadota bacterium]
MEARRLPGLPSHCSTWAFGPWPSDRCSPSASGPVCYPRGVSWKRRRLWCSPPTCGRACGRRDCRRCNGARPRRNPAIRHHSDRGADLRRASRRYPPGELERLTPRQRDILQLVAEGRTSKQIAQRLGLSVKTVERHRDDVMKRLEIHDIAGLVRWAIGHGLVTFEL